MPKFAEDLFKLEKHRLLADPDRRSSRHQSVIATRHWTRDKLPIRFCAYTPCFRSEAGSYGRDVRGIIRQHQFQKVELVKFTRSGAKLRRTGKLTADAEDILQRLGLPFRTMAAVHRRHGLQFREDLRYRSLAARPERVQGDLFLLEFRGVPGAPRQYSYSRAGRSPNSCTPLNGSGLAVGRTWVAIVENYQQKDGSVVVPEALRPYLNAEVITASAQLK